MSELFTHSPFAEPNKNPETAAPAEAPLVPPPPQESMEVVIRTMASDLELMTKGGAAPPPAVTVVPLSPAEPAKPVSIVKVIIWTVGILLGATAVFGAGYYVLPALFPPSSTESVQPERAQRPSAASSTFSQPIPPAEPMIHASFFRRSPDARITIDLSTATGRGEYEEILAAGLSVVPASSTFIEVEVREGGAAMNWTEFARKADIAVPVEDFWSSRFEPDFTMFILRESRNYWPGYILKRKDSESALLTKNAMRRIEEDRTRLAGFFLTDPRATGTEFTDTQIGGQSFRQLSYEHPSAGIIYGWIYNNYFLLSTSEAGFRRALEQF